MSRRWTWSFVDGDSPGDGDLWLSHHEQLTGWIDAVDQQERTVRRIMVATDAWMRRAISGVGTGAKWASIAQVLVVPSGSPGDIRAAIDAAVNEGALLVHGTDR